MESGIEDTIIGGRKPKLYRINKDYAYGSKNMQEIALLHSGVTIGDNVVIGAGSVITKKIPDNVIAYGNPCKVVRSNE